MSGAEDGLAIAAESPDTPEARALLAASEDAMHALYPTEANFLLDVAALEAEAVSRGIGTVMLETGDLQPGALGLYRSTGYAERGPFADYPAGPPSVFFEKRLD